ncbi:MarR family winged helix-turn-helix transcriptional regulator [Sorangium sp. So ce406]|uniref:MarR family winged helix-turn-helix transcriptional regulator n=1 Tax=Sorangium sp. So ce406 TaxID=3133311 RepID=UPI003F5AFAC6
MTSRSKPASAGLNSQLIAGLERLGSALRAQAWSEAFARGLTPTQGQVLTTLRTHRGEGLRLLDIAEALSVTPATASETVRALVAKGLVKKTQALSDGRAIKISLTKQGEGEALAVAQWPSFLLDAVDELSDEDQTAMLRGVLTIISSLQGRGYIPVAQMCVSCTNFRANAHPGEPKAHHCQLLDAAIGDPELRAQCADHAPGSAELQAENRANFMTAAGDPKRRLPVVPAKPPAIR